METVLALKELLPLLTALGNLGGLGILSAVLLWYSSRLTAHLDRQAARHSADVKGLNERHTATLEKFWGEHREQLSAERRECFKQHLRQLEALDGIRKTAEHTAGRVDQLVTALGGSR